MKKINMVFEPCFEIVIVFHWLIKAYWLYVGGSVMRIVASKVKWKAHFSKA